MVAGVLIWFGKIQGGLDSYRKFSEFDQLKTDYTEFKNNEERDYHDFHNLFEAHYYLVDGNNREALELLQNINADSSKESQFIALEFRARITYLGRYTKNWRTELTTAPMR